MKYLPYLIILFLLGVIFYQYNNPKIKEKQIINTITHTDTFIDVDSLYYPKPYLVEVKVTDTMFIDIDSIKQEGDSLILPRETKVYEDSTYKATISGFKPILEDITVYPKTIYITTEKVREIEKKQHWYYGIGGGFGYGLIHSKFDMFIGGTVGYKF